MLLSVFPSMSCICCIRRSPARVWARILLFLQGQHGAYGFPFFPFRRNPSIPRLPPSTFFFPTPPPLFFLYGNFPIFVALAQLLTTGSDGESIYCARWPAGSSRKGRFDSSTGGCHPWRGGRRGRECHSESAMMSFLLAYCAFLNNPRSSRGHGGDFLYGPVCSRREKGGRFPFGRSVRCRQDPRARR